jgi:hypothetical protein
MRDFLRIWSKLDEPVNRGTYFRYGLGLMALKYAIDATLIWFGARVVWTPFHYLEAGASWGESVLVGAPPWLLAVLGLTTLPFVSIGLTLSMRRALDAGISPWFGLLFFVPVVNYGYMAVMSLWPSRPRTDAPTIELGRRGPRALPAIVMGAVSCVSLAAVSVLVMGSYGTMLFFGVPFVVGAITAYVYNRGARASFGKTYGVVVAALVLSMVGLLGIALEGAICILMAAPLSLGIAAVGGIAGREIALLGGGARGAAAVVLVLPLTTPLDAPTHSEHREVRSVVDIAAPPDVVWHHVVTFSTLPEPTELIFRAGIAYPVRARIEGTGVGAVRYCEFSTGPFVEPITHWEPGKRLSFGITDHPPPMREWSPYRIAPPHLEGYFAARRGEFRLVALPDGHTRLEGSTWYSLDIRPSNYWAPLADALVHTIHQRVLRHIKTEAER